MSAPTIDAFCLLNSPNSNYLQSSLRIACFSSLSKNVTGDNSLVFSPWKLECRLSKRLFKIIVSQVTTCRRHRYCKNSNGIINSSEQSSFPPTSLPLTGNIRTDEIYEMQTLIPASTLVMPNGRDVSVKAENPSNGGITENQKILRTSTPTDESNHRMCIELPPIKCDEGLALQMDETKMTNGFMETFNPKASTMGEQQKELRNTTKTGGSSSPYKCFQVRRN